MAGASVWQQGVYGIELLARYARLVAVPVGLCTGRTYAEVSRPTGMFVSATFLIGCGLLALAGVASWRSYRRGGFPFVAAALVACVLVTGVVFAMPESMADRFLILPSFFLCLALGPCLSAAWNRAVWARGLLLVALAVQVALSNAQVATWSDDGHLLVMLYGLVPS